MANRDFSHYLASLRSGKFSDLWPAQEHILRVYDEECSQERNIGIELPTGAGKTLIALLIAGASLESNKKAVILSANKTLARQMRDEAKELGLPVAYMEGRGEDIPASRRRAYQRAQQIGIMNYWVYFNQNPVVDPADLVVMDDAHLAEHCLHSLYSVMITQKDHKDLFKQLIAELHERFPAVAPLARCQAARSQWSRPWPRVPGTRGRRKTDESCVLGAGASPHHGTKARNHSWRLPRPAIPQRILRTPPEPRITSPASGLSVNACCSAAYSSSDRYSWTRDVNSVLSTNVSTLDLNIRHRRMSVKDGQLALTP